MSTSSTESAAILDRSDRGDGHDVYHVRGVATRGGNMAARILMVVAVLMALYGCGQSPETADSFEGVEQHSSPEAPASGTVMPPGHDVELKFDVVDQADRSGPLPPYVYVECGYSMRCTPSPTASASASASVTGSDQRYENIRDAFEYVATVLIGSVGAVVLAVLIDLIEWLYERLYS